MILLMDNGSLEPAATLALRRMAESLSLRLGKEVAPVSLLHSSAVPAEQLNHKAAEIFEPALERRLRQGEREFLVIPAFFGPSGALTDYLPRRVAALKAKFPELRLRLAPPLVDAATPGDHRISEILAERVRQVVTNMAALPGVDRGYPPALILVDHGSPVRAVTAVRDHLTRQLQARVGHFAKAVVAASMERREGPDYAFSDPLLASVLDRPDFNSGLVVVALLFLSPGRHAGPGGDIARICAAAAARHPKLLPVLTAPIGDHPGVIEVFVDRVREGLAKDPL